MAVLVVGWGRKRQKCYFFVTKILCRSWNM